MERARKLIYESKQLAFEKDRNGQIFIMSTSVRIVLVEYQTNNNKDSSLLYTAVFIIDLCIVIEYFYYKSRYDCYERRSHLNQMYVYEVFRFKKSKFRSKMQE